MTNKNDINLNPKLSLFAEQKNNLLTLKEASKWASNYTKKKITISNISYLVKYGQIKNCSNNSSILIDREELKKYYDSIKAKELKWKEQLGKDLNWHLSFNEYKESERTKHVHRLHPYKGKFIPQLVEYFLDSHTDEYKKEVFFHKGDIILDPFVGSGTTLVQANELGLHGIGIDISAFNVLISEAKVSKYNLYELNEIIKTITNELYKFNEKRTILKFEEELNKNLVKFNNKNFPSPDYKIRIKEKLINEKKYGKTKEEEFIHIYKNIINKYNIKIKQNDDKTFLDKWFLLPVREEIDLLSNIIKQIQNDNLRKILYIIFSRTVRSSRATTHADLATLKEPVTTPYYCKKHGKVCKPIYSLYSWWKRYSQDTLKRLYQFEKLRTNTFQVALVGDSRNIDIIAEVEKKNKNFANMILNQKIAGIFSSPPYVGLINYHEQHAYAYELFGFDRKDELEIGPLFKGQGKQARKSYVESIVKVLLNSKRFLKQDYNVFLVANDKYGLYPEIAEKAGMKIVNQYKRPVLNRVEKNRAPYSEIIFHLKEK